ncbi:hypothetical protein ABEW59_29690 [Bacillus wiedmannii]|uniref:hypothetical protein n=1 Tax=Bacillus wiedmannii TaxID=1890302 RepID=UPI003D1A9204
MKKNEFKKVVNHQANSHWTTQRKIDLMRNHMLGNTDKTIVIDPEGEYLELLSQLGFTENKEGKREIFKQGDGYSIYYKM